MGRCINRNIWAEHHVVANGHARAIEHSQIIVGIKILSRIRSIIQEAIPTVSHAFIEREEAVRKTNHKSLGVEHASDESIQKALEHVYKPVADLQEEIAQSVILELGLIGYPHSSYLRKEVSKELRIGHTNGKQLTKRLKLFGISEQQLRNAVQIVQERS